MSSPAVPAGTGDIQSSRLALEQGFDKLREAVDTVIDEFNRIIGSINTYRWIIGPVPMYFIHTHMDDVRAALTKGIEIAEKVLQGGAPILSLFLTSIDYLNAVQTPVSDIGYDITTPQDDNLAYWTGGAASAYKQKQAAQKTAADKAAENAAFISKWLFDVGKTNVSYCTKLVKILTDAAVQLVSVDINAATIINLPFAADDLAAAIQKLIEGGINQLVELANQFTAMLGDVRDLLAKRNDHGAFESGRWPQAVYRN